MIDKKTYRNNPYSIVGQIFEHLLVLDFVGIINKRKTFKCLCDCGRITNVRGDYLLNNFTKRCQIGGCSKHHLKGQTINRWTILEFSRMRGTRQLWWCKCDCGKIKEKGLREIEQHKSKSCGCFSVEECVKRVLKDLTNKEYPGFKVLKRSESWNKSQLRYLCRCRCGNEFTAQGQSIRQGITTGCGCFKAILHKSRLSQLEKLGKSDKQRVKYKKKYKIWKDEVFKRDNRSCVVCGNKCSTIHAHHLNGFHWCTFREKFDINNGVTLCGEKHGCHMTFHKIYGTKYNTKIQFEQFLLNYNEQQEWLRQNNIILALSDNKNGNSVTEGNGSGLADASNVERVGAEDTSSRPIGGGENINQGSGGPAS